MIDRKIVIQAAEALEGSAVLLPVSLDAALVGYIPKAGAAVGVYSYGTAIGVLVSASQDAELDAEDRLLDAIRDARVGELEPVLIHTV